MEAYEARPNIVLAVQLTRHTFPEVRDIVNGRTWTSYQSIVFNEDGLFRDIIEVGEWVVIEQGKIKIMDDLDFQLKFQKKD